jgi:hypothetical protein
MSIRKKLHALANAIADEAERNDLFRERVESALDHRASVLTSGASLDLKARRKGGRRAAAILDPVEIARQSEAELRQRLSELNIELLRDIVAQYGMDPGKLVMKWKDPTRVVERIVELAMARSTKGDAFRAD